MPVVTGNIPLHPLEIDTGLDEFTVHIIGVRAVDPPKVRHHLTIVMYSWFAALIGFLVDLTSFSCCFEHDGLSEDRPISIEHEAHEIKRSALLLDFTVFLDKI